MNQAQTPTPTPTRPSLNPSAATSAPVTLRSWPQRVEKLLFRPLIMPLQIRLYRLTRGRIGGEAGGVRFLLLTTTGRKSGKEITTPLAYVDHDGGYLVAATNAGMPRHPGWYHNLSANPHATVQVGPRTFAVAAEEATGDERRTLWHRLLTEIPGYAAYQERTSREFPMIVLRPVDRAPRVLVS